MLNKLKDKLKEKLSGVNKKFLVINLAVVAIGKLNVFCLFYIILL